MATGRFKRITCFFIYPDDTLSFPVDVDLSSSNGEAEAIQALIIKEDLNPYNLSFVMDNGKVTYQAEYLHSRDDFQSRKDLIMETNVKKLNPEDSMPGIQRRVALRLMSEEDWIEQHASGTLRKNKRIGFTYRTQYLEERVAYEFGYGFQIVPRSQITFGDPITEGDCHAITEAGWHIERFLNMDIFGDKAQAKYIHVSYRDNSNREGVGIIVRETSASWVPTGHIVFAIIAEFDPLKKVWKDAANPF